jgi:sulfate adenylyltransferase subunit 2
VARVQDSIDTGRVFEDGPSRNRLQTVTLLDALAEHRFDAAFGGARRDEERSRAKERILSFRDELGQWEPRNQRPEIWELFNTVVRRGESVRAAASPCGLVTASLPISNWTELDVWRYIESEQLEVPSIYFAHVREVFERDGMLFAVSDVSRPNGSKTFTERVRYRTVVTGAVRSAASDVASILVETAASTTTERGATRADDRTSAAAMEDRKREGYF